MVSKCDRCHKDNHYLEACMTCSRNICRACQKSGKTADKTHRLLICKDCWGKMPLRRQWEQA